MLMQNFGVTIKEHYGMLWYFLEWSITTQLGISHPSKSGLSEAELILSRAGHFDLTKDQVEQMVICLQHRHKLGKFNYVIPYPDECFFFFEKTNRKGKKN